MAQAVSIDAGRCVHARIETASCRACVEVCPRRAWRLEDDGLNLSGSDCDGCGLCVSACPTRAISGSAWMPARQWIGGQDVLMVACDRAIPEGEDGHIPCLHAIGIHELLHHWQKGERIWLASAGDCDRCERGQGERLATRFDHLNNLFQARGRHQTLLKHVPTDQWRRLRQLGNADSRQARDHRRGFLSRLVHRPVPVLAGGKPLEGDGYPDSAPGEYLPGNGPLPWTMQLDATVCVACHACIEVCPAQALGLEGGVQGNAVSRAFCYRLEHSKCVGCGLCVDVCDTHAIALRPWSRPDQALMLLHESTCGTCGVRFLIPTGRMSADAGADVCWVCARKRHGPRLFQVLDVQDPGEGKT